MGVLSIWDKEKRFIQYRTNRWIVSCDLKLLKQMLLLGDFLMFGGDGFSQLLQFFQG